MTEEHKRKISEAHKRNGHKPPLRTGCKMSAESRLKMSISKTGKKVMAIANEKHPQWRGDRVGYSSLHGWIRRHYGSPSKCDECGCEDAPRYEWANISGEYRRERSDFARLCRKCHYLIHGGQEIFHKPIEGERKTVRNTYFCKMD